MGLFLFFIIFLTLLIAYRFYALRKSRMEVEPNASRSTPARRYMDGIEFIPSQRSILTGYQFKSISLDVVIGPVIAIQFGWLPALIWLLVGTVFFGWVQDSLVTILSMRRAGNSLIELLAEFFQPEVKSVALVFLLIFLLAILGQFGILLSTLLTRGAILFNIFLLVSLSFIFGQLVYRWRINLIFATIIPILIILLGFVFTTDPEFDVINAFITGFFNNAGSNFPSQPFGVGNISLPTLISALIIMLVCFLASILPIWRISVPFNYLSAIIIFSGLLLAIGGYIYGILNETIPTSLEIPAFTSGYQPALGPIWPMLIVTLSSGAISGWNAVVSSFTTSKQIEKEPVALPVTIGPKFTETIFVATVIIFAATFGVSSGIFDPNQGYSLAAGPASVFAVGMATSASAVGIPESLGASFSTLLLAIMLITIMQIVLRIARHVSTELFGKRLPVFRNPSISTLTVILITLVIIIFGIWQWLWVLFAGANQLLAAVALLLVSTWLVKRGKSYRWTIWPAVFMFISAIAALIYTAIYQPIISSQESNPSELIGNLIIFALGLGFISMGTYMFFAGWRAFNKARSPRPAN